MYRMGWRDTPELPLAEDIMKEAGELPRENHLNAVYLHKDAYFEVQYELLRHEGVEPIRKAVQEYRSAPEMIESAETCVYTDVFVRGTNIIRLGVMIRVTFSSVRARHYINWPVSQRLVPGTIVALSPAWDNFQTRCIVASVTGRYDELIDSPMTPPPLDLEIHDAQTTAGLMDPDQDYVMIEARSSYFEAVRHVLEGLKHAAQDESPFDKYLVRGSNSVDRLASMPCSASSVDISTLNDGIRRSASMPIPVQGDITNYVQSKARLDKSQMLALQRMVTKELAIVQGPPGTGKTHTSMAALKVLLSMQPFDVPIIVTAQKNDTVDELLVRCHNLGINFVRIGGQSKNKTVSDRSLVSLRVQSRGNTWRRDGYQKRLDILKSQARRLLKRCFPPRNQQLILPEHFREVGLISSKQYDSIAVSWDGDVKSIGGQVARHPLGPWLGDQVLSAKPHRSIHVPLNGGAGVEVVSEHESSEDVAVRNMKEQLTGKPILMSRWNSMRLPDIAGHDPGSSSLAKQLLDGNPNLWDIAPDCRGIVYQYLERLHVLSTKLALGTVFKQVNEVVKKLKLIRLREDVDTVRKSGARIIGCTTTGLTKYRGLIAATQPRVMMIEEAAEIREANITAALFPSLQQIILVGDHMQLAPHADVLELSRPPFNLKVSLFQKLVERGLEYSSLQIQRRMAPDVRKLLSAWYPLLVDHPCTESQGAIPGMGAQTLLWFDHRHAESSDRYSSKFNAFEADMVVGLYDYLVLNGTIPSDITILTFYNGQKSYILNSLRRKYSFASRYAGDGEDDAGPEVQTVDGYQGKENEIVLVSVTRSPKNRSKPDAGFLKDQMRAIVALSRPRRLLVVLGDTQNLLASSAQPIWSECHGGSCKPALGASIPDRSAASTAQTSSELSTVTRASVLSTEKNLIDL
ncbi:Helicase required for RNAi-mediated heterochromatin assembly 1 [Colletotrichum higginsianum]|uniref:Helicase required for RNAi-mediated heterochromatin assembly 1 n=1 Tax=Colletotrichum higginsianum TaxID=80884 RepID=A0A4T0VTA0_9PEZI|nr:Helicase required for RNAi-mediated heterochromatin assembly 1 [Colletotrichum higginsianum]